MESEIGYLGLGTESVEVFSDGTAVTSHLD